MNKPTDGGKAGKSAAYKPDVTAPKRDRGGVKVVASNRKASFNYDLETRFEAGIARER